MTQLAIIKGIVSTVVGIGTYQVTGAVIANNVAATNAFGKIAIGSTKIVVGMMASEATRAYTDKKIDELTEAWKSASS